MLNDSSTRTAAVLLCGVLAATTGCASGRDRGAAMPAAEHASYAPPSSCSSDPAEPSRFTFHSSFWLNLHNFLFKEAKHGAGIRDDGLGALGNVQLETEQARPLTRVEEVVWRRALDLYLERVVTGPKRDSVVIRVNNRLALVDSEQLLATVDLDDEVRRVLIEAAPVYREVWWPAHDRQNRAWIAEMQGYLARFEGCAAPRIAAAFRTAWPVAPVRVDATVYANWFGAYTTQNPPHVTVSSVAVGAQGASGLETLLHEGGHALLPALERQLAATGERLGRRVPPELSHALLFFTAGNAVWRVVPGHQTNAARFGIWDRNDASRRLRALLVREWRPYLRGETDLEAALTALIEAGDLGVGP